MNIFCRIKCQHDNNVDFHRPWIAFRQQESLILYLHWHRSTRQSLINYLKTLKHTRHYYSRHKKHCKSCVMDACIICGSKCRDHAPQKWSTLKRRTVTTSTGTLYAFARVYTHTCAYYTLTHSHTGMHAAQVVSQVQGLPQIHLAARHDSRDVDDGIYARRTHSHTRTHVHTWLRQNRIRRAYLSTSSASHKTVGACTRVRRAHYHTIVNRRPSRHSANSAVLSTHSVMGQLF